MKIPSNNIWTQTNKGDIAGVLHETENITLDTDGKITLSKKTLNRFDTNSDSDLGEIMAFVFYDDRYIAYTTGTASFLVDFNSTTTGKISSTAGSVYSDMLLCYSKVYLTTSSNLLSYTTGSLVTGLYSLTSNVPHPMALFDSLVNNKLCIGNGNTVVPLNSSHVAGTILSLPSQYQVTTLAYKNGYLYVGTKNLNGGEAKVFVWDGNSTNANYEVSTGSQKIYSIIPYKESVAFITNTGRLAVVSGNSAITIASLPVYNTPNVIWDNTTYSYALPKIIHRGMVAINDKIYLSVNGTVDSGYISTMKHGLWVYDPEKGLYHRSHASQDKNVYVTPSALSDSTLTVAAHSLKDGDLVLVNTLGSLTGVSINTKYYAKVVSTTEIKLALSKKALLNDNYVTIGGAVTSSFLSYAPNTDYSTYNNTFSGAITAINPESSFFPGWESPIIWGSRFETKAGVEFNSIMTMIDAWNIGRFTTQRIYTPNIKQNWQTLYGFFSGLTLDNEKIIIKYKTDSSKNYPTDVFEGVWLDSTTINSTGNADVDEWEDLEVGNELTILDGYGRGYTTHITAITKSVSTYSVTVDEAIGTASGTVYFSADSFIKVAEIDNNKSRQGMFKESLIGVSSPFIILKIEMRGFEIEVDMLDLINAVNESGN